MVFFEGRIHIDNNLVENAIRPTALGKKNWMFLGDADAGYRRAILYTPSSRVAALAARVIR